MKWQLLDKNNEPLNDGCVFDDGLAGSPGSEGFTTDPVRLEVEKREGAAGFNYIGESEKEIKA